MSEAVLAITFAGPLVTVQDSGRRGNLRFGVSASGPMDRLSFDAANAALGNPAGHPAIEVSAGGLMLHCKRGVVSLGIAGGVFVVEHAGRRVADWTVLTLHEGERLAVRAGASGSWAYIAIAGDVVASDWLGSLATHSTSGFGGKILRTGQEISVQGAMVRDNRVADIARPDFQNNDPFRVVLGPQEHQFADGSAETLLGGGYRVSEAYDRMGMRLSGPVMALDGALSIPSEPVLRGAIQVSGEGVPTVLLADHQTTGGYPKIATVISCDLDRLVQCRAGEEVAFAAVSAQEAVAIVRDHATARAAYLEEVGEVSGTLEERLMRENLIHGCINLD